MPCRVSMWRATTTTGPAIITMKRKASPARKTISTTLSPLRPEVTMGRGRVTKVLRRTVMAYMLRTEIGTSLHTFPVKVGIVAKMRDPLWEHEGRGPKFLMLSCPSPPSPPPSRQLNSNNGFPIDEGTIKTTNSKCRLH